MSTTANGGLYKSLAPGYPAHNVEWRAYEKILLRFFVLYFALQIIPLDWKFYRQLFSINWLQFTYADIFNISHYTPTFFSGGQSFANWLLIGLFALAGTFVWGSIEKRKSYTVDNNALYYWLRVLVRYRLAIAAFAYGILKFFPLLAPYPSVSNLNTRYGDYTAWKLFSLSLGVVPSYEIFLGLVEIIAGLLLLYRRTASLGAFIIIFFLGNVFFSNLAYEGGEYVYSFYLVSLALFVFSFDALRLYNLVGLERTAAPNTYQLVLAKKWQRYTRLGLKFFVLFFFLFVYGYQASSALRNGGYKYPSSAGLPGTEGIYNVSVFVVNKDTLAYSVTDSSRWQDVVFEKWPTISIRSNRPVPIDSANTELVTVNEQQRSYELEGAQSRHYYSYTVDTVNRQLTLVNKNRNYAGETLQLHYSQPSPGEIILSGINEKKDSVQVVLSRINKKYLLEEVKESGRRKALKF